MRDLVLVSIVLFLTVVALGRPHVGLIAYYGLTLLNLHSMTWSFARSFPFAQTIALGLFLGLLFWSEPKRLPIGRETLLMFLL